MGSVCAVCIACNEILFSLIRDGSFGRLWPSSLRFVLVSVWMRLHESEFQRLLRELFYSHSHPNQPVNIKQPQDTVLHHKAAGLIGTSCSKEYHSIKLIFFLLLNIFITSLMSKLVLYIYV